MIDVFAGLSLAAAAAKIESPIQLIEDANLLYSAYTQSKTAKINFEQLAASGKLQPLVAAASRVSAVANTLVKDPEQMKNIVALLSSI